MNAVLSRYEVDARFGRYWVAAGPETRSAVFLGTVEKTERNAALVAEVVAGARFKDVALRYGVSVARAQQIFWKAFRKELAKLKYQDYTSGERFWTFARAKRLLSYQPPPFKHWTVERCQSCDRLEMVVEGFCAWCVPLPEE